VYEWSQGVQDALLDGWGTPDLVESQIEPNPMLGAPRLLPLVQRDMDAMRVAARWTASTTADAVSSPKCNPGTLNSSCNSGAHLNSFPVRCRCRWEACQAVARDHAGPRARHSSKAGAETGFRLRGRAFAQVCSGNRGSRQGKGPAAA